MLPLVYLVDDSSTVRAMARAVAGYDVRAFASWPELLAALELCAPAALVADISMPSPDTFELLRDHRVPRLPLVLMSGHQMDELLPLAARLAEHAGLTVVAVRKGQGMATTVASALDALLE